MQSFTGCECLFRIRFVIEENTLQACNLTGSSTLAKGRRVLVLAALDVMSRECHYQPLLRQFLNIRCMLPPHWSPACVGTHLWSDFE